MQNNRKAHQEREAAGACMAMHTQDERAPAEHDFMRQYKSHLKECDRGLKPATNIVADI